MRKLSFNVNDVLPQIMQAASAVCTKNTMAILSDVVITTYTGKSGVSMMCSASDGENFVHVKCPVVSSEDDVFVAVNAKDFVSSLRNLSGRVVEMSVDEERNIVKCSYDNGYFELPYDNANEFPNTNVCREISTTKTIGADVLVDIFGFTDCAVGNDTLRPVINGVHFDFFESELVAVSFDGFKMAKYTNKTITSETPISFNLPSSACRLIRQMIQKECGDVKVEYCEHYIRVSSSKCLVIARLYEGKYPPYNMLLANNYPVNISVGREALVSALKTISPSSNANSEQVVFLFSKGNLNICADNYEFSKKASADVPCDWDGKQIKIAFKCSWISTLVSNIASENATFMLLDEKKAVLVVPEAQDENVEYIYLLMPMLII